MTTLTPSPVMATPAAPTTDAANHFQQLLSLETDCADVNAALQAGTVDFALLDVRSAPAFAAGHIAGAASVPTATIEPATLDAFGSDTTFVVYCAGPHCNGADKAALRIARLGRPVKKMIGGVTGWLDEGLTLTTEEA